jgi:hypothetical protein
VEESILSEVRLKLGATLDGQAGAELLTWACALVAAQLPDAESPHLYGAMAGQAPGQMTELDPLPWEDVDISALEWEEEPATELRATSATSFPPTNALPLGDPATDETVRWGWQLITLGGEQLWVTPLHLVALELAKPKLFGSDGWIPTLGFRSSPTPYEPACDFYVMRTCTPPVRLEHTAYFVTQEYHHATRSRQHLVLAFAAKPEGLPW